MRALGAAGRRGLLKAAGRAGVAVVAGDGRKVQALAGHLALVGRQLDSVGVAERVVDHAAQAEDLAAVDPWVGRGVLRLGDGRAELLKLLDLAPCLAVLDPLELGIASRHAGVGGQLGAVLVADWLEHGGADAPGLLAHGRRGLGGARAVGVREDNVRHHDRLKVPPAGAPVLAVLRLGEVGVTSGAAGVGAHNRAVLEAHRTEHRRADAADAGLLCLRLLCLRLLCRGRGRGRAAIHRLLALAIDAGAPLLPVGHPVQAGVAQRTRLVGGHLRAVPQADGVVHGYA
mmetsp:Transcript_5260/g.13368  ORF Transcript_5260/g.13368 Transcript_5260/m.13368 type:complete len:287 (-) Transcript_5260:40-900(-)